MRFERSLSLSQIFRLIVFLFFLRHFFIAILSWWVFSFELLIFELLLLINQTWFWSMTYQLLNLYISPLKIIFGCRQRSHFIRCPSRSKIWAFGSGSRLYLPNLIWSQIDANLSSYLFSDTQILNFAHEQIDTFLAVHFFVNLKAKSGLISYFLILILGSCY